MLFEAKPRTHCPHCGTVLEVKLVCKAVTIGPTREALDAAQPGRLPTPPAAPVRTPAEQAFLEAAARAGLIEPFRQVVTLVKPGDGIPKDMEGFFLQFVQKLRQRLIPGYAMEAFNHLFGRRPLAYYTALAIGVVVVDGYLRLFVPNTTVLGTRLRGLNRNGHGGNGSNRVLKIDDGEAKLQEWIRTRWGYVAEDGALLQTLRARSFGDFARPNLSGL